MRSCQKIYQTARVPWERLSILEGLHIGNAYHPSSKGEALVASYHCTMLVCGERISLVRSEALGERRHHRIASLSVQSPIIQVPVSRLYEERRHHGLHPSVGFQLGVSLMSIFTLRSTRRRTVRSLRWTRYQAPPSGFYQSRSDDRSQSLSHSKDVHETLSEGQAASECEDSSRTLSNDVWRPF